MQNQESKSRCHLQYNKGGEVGECIIWNVCDLVEGQCHGLQRGQGVQCCHWDFCQGVVIQPQVSKRANSSKGPSRNLRQQVSIKTPTGENNYLSTVLVVFKCIHACACIRGWLTGRLLWELHILNLPFIFGAALEAPDLWCITMLNKLLQAH